MMATNQQTNAMKLKLFFRLLPVLGIILIAFGAYRAWSKMVIFDVGVVGSTLLGALLFLTLFVKAEVANIKYYLNVFAYSAFVATICIVCYMFTRQYANQIDLTKGNVNSLSDQSAKVLKSLKSDVEIVAFTPRATQYREVQELYAPAGKHLTWTFVDARKDPLKTRQYGDNLRNGNIIIKSGQKKKQITENDLTGGNVENAITNAIIEVTRQKDVKIYFLTGHGELALERKAQSMMRQQRRATDEEPTLSQFKANLDKQALQTATLNLGEKSFVPEDAAMIVIAGPQADLNKGEVAALEKYLAADGKLLITLDIPRNALAAAVPMDNLKGMLKKYGVEAPDKIVLDLVGNQVMGSPVHPMVTWLNPDQPVTSDFSGRLFNLFLDQARPVQPATDQPTAFQVTELLKTSPESWAENYDVLSSGKAAPPAQRAAQTVALAVSAAQPPQQPGMPPQPELKGGMRMVVMGTSDLLGDTAQSRNQVAVALAMNSVNWLTQQEDLIAIPPKQVEGTPLVLDTKQLGVVFFLTILLLPFSLFFGGVSYTLMRRRR